MRFLYKNKFKLILITFCIYTKRRLKKRKTALEITKEALNEYFEEEINQVPILRLAGYFLNKKAKRNNMKFLYNKNAKQKMKRVLRRIFFRKDNFKDMIRETFYKK